jgi:hypothetical protein
MDNDILEEMDLKIINFIKMINNKENNKIPEPKYFTISTQSAMCNIDGINNIDLAKAVVFIAKNIIKNIILKKNEDYLIRGLIVDNIIIRFDEMYLKKYKRPLIKYMGNSIDISNIEEISNILNNIHVLENNSLKKQGRQKKVKENEDFYNSCSFIVKASKDIKPVNIKLFNNGKITLTGSKDETDGLYSSCILLNELKKEIKIFPDLIQLDEISTEKFTLDEIKEQNIIKKNIFKQLKIMNYQITMINSDFNTNFKIDLIKLLTILNNNDKELFTKFNPEKYRGLMIGFYWNKSKNIQCGKCLCKIRCKGKGNGDGEGNCKKITIAIFKSGSVIITGGRLVKQIEDSYKFINNIFAKYYHDIIKLSILDFINEDNDDIENIEDIEHNEDNEDNDYNEDILTNKKENNIINIEKPKKIKISKNIINDKKDKSFNNNLVQIQQKKYKLKKNINIDKINIENITPTIKNNETYL